MLILDESADKNAGDKSAGSGRQYNGRLGKVDRSQVGTFLGYANGLVWTWVDGELYLPEHWFAPEMAELREKLGIPDDRVFDTKIELGWDELEAQKYLASYREKKGHNFRLIIIISQCCRNTFYLN